MLLWEGTLGSLLCSLHHLRHDSSGLFGGAPAYRPVCARVISQRVPNSLGTTEDGWAISVHRKDTRRQLLTDSNNGAYSDNPEDNTELITYNEEATYRNYNNLNVHTG
jgi:hypothetical protein